MAIYQYNTGQLLPLDSAQRTWVGTQTAWEALSDENKPKNCLVCFTDDWTEEPETLEFTRNTTNASGGSILAYKTGNTVQIIISGVTVNGNTTTGSLVIASGLPTAFTNSARCFLLNTSKGNAKSNTTYPTIAQYGVSAAWVNSSGNLLIDINSAIPGDSIWGSFTYICN